MIEDDVRVLCEALVRNQRDDHGLGDDRMDTRCDGDIACCVDDDDLERRVIQGDDRLQDIVEPGARVVGDECDGDERVAHGCGCPSGIAGNAR